MRRERNRKRLQDPAEQRIDIGGWLSKLGVTHKIQFRDKVGSPDRVVFVRNNQPITRGLNYREARLFLQGLENGLKLTNISVLVWDRDKT